MFESLFCRLDRFFKTARVPEDPGKSHESIRKFRHCIEHISVSRNRLVKPARVVVTPAQRLQHTRRKRIELACEQHLLEAFVETSFHHEMKGVPVMTGGVVWIDFD